MITDEILRSILHIESLLEIGIPGIIGLLVLIVMMKIWYK